MLTEKDLAIMRAALQYFDEEISPAGNDALTLYLDDGAKTLGLTTTDIEHARARLEKVALYYAWKTLGVDQLDSVDLIPASNEDQRSYLADRVELVSVLAPTK